jgi:hypothetical protein
VVRSQKYPRFGALCATVLLASTTGFATDAQAGALAIGPVQQVNVRSSTLVVLGQNYHLGPAARIRTANSVIALGSIAPGTLVSIDGTESASGVVDVQDVVVLPQLNVPGATQLLATGVISALSNVGTIRIGGLTVDINATLTSDAQTASVGQLVQVVGTQPNPRGVLLAQSVSLATKIADGASAQGIEGSGAAVGIEGSGAAKGIEGSGAAVGIEGSGAAVGIEGSGAAVGIEGSGAAVGIEGSGAAVGIEGSGTAVGIEGSGAAVGIEGSGAAVGIEGSGAAVGIEGSGAAKGIEGSGAAVGIEGSGAAKGIKGSGAAVGIEGSG